MNGSNINGKVDISSYTGFCQLSLDATEIEELNSYRPIQFLSIENAEYLYEVNSVTPFGSGTNDLYQPYGLSLEGSDDLRCGQKFEVIDRWDVAPHVDMTIPIAIDMGGGVTGYSPVCPAYNFPHILETPQSCKPDQPKDLEVYAESVTERIYLDWKEHATQKDWGNTWYEFRLLDALGNVISEYSIGDVIDAPVCQ